MTANTYFDLIGGHGCDLETRWGLDPLQQETSDFDDVVLLPDQFGVPAVHR